MTDVRVLLLEDNKDALLAMQEALADIEGVTVTPEPETTRWVACVERDDYDLLVTDVMHDATHQQTGKDVVAKVYARRFVPIVLHSGAPDLDDITAPYKEHPFVRAEPKTADSIVAVAEAVGAWRELALGLRTIREDVQRAYQVAMEQTALAFAKVDADLTKLLPNLVRRRIAATFDLPAQGEYIHPAERFLIPPPAGPLLTGDVLREVGGDPRDATTLRLVLSQSCDIAWSHGKRQPKCGEALVCRTADVGVISERLQDLRAVAKDPPPSGEDLKNYAASLAKGDFAGSIVALPPVPQVLPEPVLFDLRRLELIPLEAIVDGCEKSASGKPKFQKVACQDSPYREQISWAVATMLGRPGMPDADWKQLAGPLRALMKTLIDTEKKENQKKGDKQKELGGKKPVAAGERPPAQEAERARGREGSPEAGRGGATGTSTELAATVRRAEVADSAPSPDAARRDADRPTTPDPEPRPATQNAPEAEGEPSAAAEAPKPEKDRGVKDPG